MHDTQRQAVGRGPVQAGLLGRNIGACCSNMCGLVVQRRVPFQCCLRTCNRYVAYHEQQTGLYFNYTSGGTPNLSGLTSTLICSSTKSSSCRSLLH